jgi:glycosyltransferase involved in cell wall biosynthesis
VKRVLAITNNLRQASYRLRVAALIDPLAERGVKLEVKVRPRQWSARRQLLRSAEDYDAVLLQRKLLDGWDARLLARHARRVYFDVDDAVMYSNGPADWFSRWRNWRRFLATAKHVDHVVAGNAYLAELFRQRGCEVSVLPTTVDLRHYSAKTHSATDRPTLVWIGSSSTLPYLRQATPALESASKVVAGLRLLIVADQTLTPSPLPTDFVPWSAVDEAGALCIGDIGIAPTPLDQWTLGKCGYKIVQYMAARLPVIASPVGANAEIVVDGKTGYLPATWADWPANIARLATDADLRARLGTAGRERAERDFSLQRAADFWADLLSR